MNYIIFALGTILLLSVIAHAFIKTLGQVTVSFNTNVSNLHRELVQKGESYISHRKVKKLLLFWRTKNIIGLGLAIVVFFTVGTMIMDIILRIISLGENL